MATTVKEWKKYYAIGSDQGPEYAMKFADSVIRFKKHTLKLEKKRHTSILLDKMPTHEVKKCSARLMSGKKCTFRATCGEYCKKHAV
jgi:hypothetical protein